MRRVGLLLAGIAFCAACQEGGCSGEARPQSAPETQSFARNAGGGASAEAVSFQKTGLGGKDASGSQGTAASTTTAPSAPADLSARPSATEAAAYASAGFADVPCDGFPDLPADCLSSPRLADLRKKCCPDGAVVACRAVPGGATLTARGCPAPRAPRSGALTPPAAPQAAP